MLSREILPLVITAHINAVVTVYHAERIEAVPYPFSLSQPQNPWNCECIFDNKTWETATVQGASFSNLYSRLHEYLQYGCFEQYSSQSTMSLEDGPSVPCWPGIGIIVTIELGPYQTERSSVVVSEKDPLDFLGKK